MRCWGEDIVTCALTISIFEALVNKNKIKKMKVTRLKANEVNGILNFDIKFNDNLSFLIGINGSGKTTALKLLLGLITPSYAYISRISFQKASLECVTDSNEKIRILASRKNEDSIELELKIQNVTKAKSTVDLYDQGIEYSDDTEALVNRNFQHLKVVRAIQDLKTPIFLGLDRRILHRKIFGGPTTGYELRKFRATQIRRRKNYSSNDPMDNSIIEIQELVNDYIREIAKKQPLLTEEFKSEILNNSINYYEEEHGFKLEGIPENQLKKKRESLEESLKNLAIGDFKQRINKFFEEFEKLNREIREYAPKTNGIENRKDLNKFSRLYSQMIVNSMQLKRIDDIIELSKEYQEEIAGLREPINRLNGILQKFFKESQKKIEVQPNGEFEIILPNDKIATPYELSSGEKQILIMITHLIFYEDRTSPGIFIIDEPELSLHLGWQEIFVNSIIEASPNTQFILATHSPTIIGSVENEKYCIDIKQ